MEPAAKAPHAAMLPQPPEAADAAQAVTMDNFLLRGGLVDAWFLRRSDVLLVTFDNLSSIGEYDPPQPWLQARAARGGLSILGILASRKDWYRNADTAGLIIALRDAGLFAGFRRVVFTGASMGGFAALAYSALVPGSTVLAFSPQSTLSRKIAPFERRYTYAQRKWDWKSPDFLDAALAVPLTAEVVLVYDPFVPEDRLHAKRLAGPNVETVALDHFGHKAIRGLKPLGVLQMLIDGVAKGTLDHAALHQGLRKRRSQRSWQRTLLA